VNIPSSTVLPTGTAPRTLCAWAKSNSLSDYHWIASYGTASTNQAMFIGMIGTSLVGGGWAADLTVPNFWDNNWHFIALTYDGTTASLYADGVLKASAAESWNLVPSKCYIGEMVSDLAQYWNGQIDDVRIYNRALSAADVASLVGVSNQYAGAPYGGTAWAIPGKVEAENYDNGGQNVSYRDASAGNAGGVYRTDDVDVRATVDTGGGYEVGWTDTGEWLNYTVNVASSGNYDFQLRVASGQTGGSVHIEIDGANVTGPISIPNTGNWDNTFTTLIIPNIAVPAGKHVMRLVIDSGSWGPEVNWINVVPSYTGTPYGGTAWPVPGKVEAENYDNGGEGVGYHDDSSGNTGGGYTRSDNVDIRATSDTGSGYQVGWTDTGEWLKYTLNVTSAGHYTCQVRTASGVTGSAHIEIDGVNVSGPISIQNTGGWDTFTTLSATGISLTPGRHVMRFYWDAGGPDLNWFNFVRTGA